MLKLYFIVNMGLDVTNSREETDALRGSCLLRMIASSISTAVKKTNLTILIQAQQRVLRGRR